MTEQPDGNAPDLERSTDPLKALRDHIRSHHQTNVPDGDPILIAYTAIQYAALEHENSLVALLDAWQERVESGLNGVSKNVSTEVERALHNLQDETLNGAVRANLARMAEQTRHADDIQSSFKIHRRSLWMITFVNIGVLVATLLFWMVLIWLGFSRAS